MRPVIGVLLSAVAASSAGYAQCTGEWEALTSYAGPSFKVTGTTLWDPDGAGPRAEALVVVGGVHSVGATRAYNVVTWDGQTWSPLGTMNTENAEQSWARCAAVHAGQLFVGTDVGGPLVRWTGSNWAQVPGLTGTCNALGSNGTHLIAVGTFDMPGGAGSQGAGVWNGTQWSFISMTTAVNAVAMLGSTPFIANFRPNASSDLVSWNGSAWVTDNVNLADTVEDLVVHNNKVLILYKTAAGTRYIRERQSLSNYTPFPGAVPTGVNHLCSSGGELFGIIPPYLATSAESPTVYRFVPATATWQVLGSSTMQTAGVTKFQGRTLAYGDFITMDRRAACGMAEWNGTRWAALTNGTSGTPTSIANFRGEVVIAGDIYNSAAEGARIQRWTGDSWTPLLPLQFCCEPKVAVYENDLIITGTSVASQPNVTGVLRWNGTSLSSMGNDNATTPFVTGGRLYVTSGTWVDRWDDGVWTRLGGTFGGGVVKALHEHSGQLYAAGSFRSNTGATMVFIARWNGSAWVAVPGLVPTSSTTYASGLACMTSSQGNLVVGGGTPVVGASGTQSLASYDGSTWTALPRLSTGSPTSLVAHGNRLLIGTWGRSIYSYENGALTAVGDMGGLMGTHSTAFYHDASGVITTGYFGRIGGAVAGGVARLSTPACCGPQDFNGDGDSGTDQDIEAFFACLGGNCCAACGPADFNGDGDTGTDQDIEAFFRVLGGGAC